ncbi:MAG: hypothetical protein MH252_17325 [Thermosynechococcaceae cyanobacterium MS004]|nr:hypothetical protein [Thermosynechococcaceae cyanobacterium MS004]
MVSHAEVRSTRPSEAMSDEVLIQTFIEEFFHGQTVLLSNHHLRTEPLFDSMQLLSTKEGIIATAKLKTTPMEIVVRHGSPSGKLMHDILRAQSFYPMSKAPAEGCYIYRYCEAPEGYELQCATAKELWRACWGRGIGLRSGIPMDLLVWRKGLSGSKETWYSLKGMECEHGQLRMKLLGWVDQVQGTDLVVWARQLVTKKAPGPSQIANSQGFSPSSQTHLSEMRSRPPFRQ